MDKEVQEDDSEDDWSWERFGFNPLKENEWSKGNTKSHVDY
jgi:hypothetical protein